MFIAQQGIVASFLIGVIKKESFATRRNRSLECVEIKPAPLVEDRRVQFKFSIERNAFKIYICDERILLRFMWDM